MAAVESFNCIINNYIYKIFVCLMSLVDFNLIPVIKKCLRHLFDLINQYRLYIDQIRLLTSQISLIQERY